MPGCFGFGDFCRILVLILTIYNLHEILLLQFENYMRNTTMMFYHAFNLSSTSHGLLCTLLSAYFLRHPISQIL